MSYIPSTNFAAKDALLTGNPAKIVKGTEISAEFSAISTAINTLELGTVPQTSATGSAWMPTGTTAQRDGAPVIGYVRVNSDLAILEWWNGTSWIPVGAASPGDMKMWPNATAPTGWLKCDGASVLVATYPALHAIIGYTFGGAGANFNLPNLTNKTLVGAGGLYAVGATGGSKDAVVVSHSHTASSTDAGHTHPAGLGVILVGGGAVSGVSSLASATGSGFANISTTVNSTGVSGTDANMPPYLGVSVVIKT